MGLLATSFLLVGPGGKIANAAMPPFEPIAGFAPDSIMYDEPGGQFDRWFKKLPCEANRADVTVKFLKRDRDSKWSPLARLQINPPEEVNEKDWPYEALGATVNGPWGRSIPPLTYVQWNSRDAYGKPQIRNFRIAPVDIRDPVHIEVSWTPDGTATFSFNEGPLIVLPAIGPITSIGAFVSSSKFEFMNLRVGHAGPPGFNSSCAS